MNKKKTCGEKYSIWMGTARQNRQAIERKIPRCNTLLGLSVVTALMGVFLFNGGFVANADELTSENEIRASEAVKDFGIPLAEGKIVEPQTEGEGVEASQITVPLPGEAFGDVLGLGSPQYISFQDLGEHKGRVNISQSRGGAVLKWFDPSEVRAGWPGGAGLVIGGQNMKRAGLLSNHIAVAGKSIYVTDFYQDDAVNSLVKKNESIASVYQFSPDGALVNMKTFTGVDTLFKRNGLAVAALDAFVFQGKTYVAVGLNQYGVRILDGETLEEVKALYTNWMAPSLPRGDTVSAVKFGVNGSGRLVLAVSKFTYNDHALYLADVESGKDLWKQKYQERSWGPQAWEWAKGILFSEPRGGAAAIKLLVSWSSTECGAYNISSGYSEPYWCF